MASTYQEFDSPLSNVGRPTPNQNSEKPSCIQLAGLGALLQGLGQQAARAPVGRGVVKAADHKLQVQVGAESQQLHQAEIQQHRVRDCDGEP